LSDNKKIKFLLGSNTKVGFVPLFDELRDPINSKRLYILKGGPGSGKSTLMKKVLKVLENKNDSIEYIHCASDPGSLDAFIDYDAGIAMVDGTAPHIMDPGYPGAYDVIINMADCWDDSSLIQDKNKIISLSDTISTCHKMATSCISSAAALLESNIHLAKPYVKYDTINDFIAKLMKRLEGFKTGREKKRLLSAVSVGETVFFGETIEALSNSIYVIPDIWGAASHALLSELHRATSILSLEQIVCYCSIRTPDKIDHIIFPSAGIAVTTANSFHAKEDKKHIVIPDLMNSIPNIIEEQMSLHLNKTKELIDIACDHVKRAKLLHDDLEAFYVKAMDFSKVDLIYERIIKEIL
jgi:energy-coupling factor transporter ATP-binding protein EcfA2